MRSRKLLIKRKSPPSLPDGAFCFLVDYFFLMFFWTGRDGNREIGGLEKDLDGDELEILGDVLNCVVARGEYDLDGLDGEIVLLGE